MKYRNIARQAGFTLVEIAIVLVIIGLLLGGVLKGQEMIENAKVKNAINDLKGVTAAFNSYVDRFRTIPGDDGPLATLQARGGTWTGITVAGNADGVLTITAANAFAPGGEEVAFWQHLRASGFIAGNPVLIGTAALPRNAFNGNMAVANNTLAATTGMSQGISTCLGQVPGKAARQMDTQEDDGNPATGTVRATLGVAGTNTTPGTAAVTYSDDLQYTVCRTM